MNVILYLEISYQVIKIIKVIKYINLIRYFRKIGEPLFVQISNSLTIYDLAAI